MDGLTLSIPGRPQQRRIEARGSSVPVQESGRAIYSAHSALRGSSHIALSGRAMGNRKFRKMDLTDAIPWSEKYG